MQTQTIANPFALLLDPASVVAQMERSERLNRLSSRVCRPLDKAHPPEGSGEASQEATGREATDAGSGRDVS